jgi:p-cumate 2,3-dioxygenase beta subunit
MKAIESSMSDRLMQRLLIEDFLYREAALLDAWRLAEWLELYTEDCRYFVPATDLPDGDPRATLGLIDDDRARLKGRVDRLSSAKAYREFPWSRTTRLITNVRVLGSSAEGCAVAANFSLFRARTGREQTLVGTLRHVLVEHEDDFQIRSKRIVLTNEALRPHGTVSIIL